MKIRSAQRVTVYCDRTGKKHTPREIPWFGRVIYAGLWLKGEKAVEVLIPGTPFIWVVPEKWVKLNA